MTLWDVVVIISGIHRMKLPWYLPLLWLAWCHCSFSHSLCILHSWYSDPIGPAGKYILHSDDDDAVSFCSFLTPGMVSGLATWHRREKWPWTLKEVHLKVGIAFLKTQGEEWVSTVYSFCFFCSPTLRLFPRPSLLVLMWAASGWTAAAIGRALNVLPWRRRARWLTKTQEAVLLTVSLLPG